jgi:biotin operon repressor
MTTTNNTFNTARKFGVEIEFKGVTRTRAESALRDAGLNVVIEGYNHDTRSHWKIVSDGSVHGGWELVSPPLSGVEGLREVKLAAETLVNAGAYVDRDCGLHVHVDGANLSAATIVNMTKRYALHENEINKLIPSFRHSCSWAQGMSNVATLVSDYLRSNPTATARAISEQIDSRYYKLNLQAYLRHGTIEFRQHSGTCDGTKIANWIMFCVRFVEDSIVTVVAPAAPVQTVQVPSVPATSERANAIARKFSKMLELFANIGSYGTLSASTIATALEISEASIPSYVSMLRNRYPSVKIRAARGRGYYTTTNALAIRAVLTGQSVAVAPVTAPVAPSVTVVVPVDRGVYATLPRPVAAYYQERAHDFGSTASL